MSARIFIRNDDVATLEPRFQFFFKAAFEREIPIVHAVIPGKMDPALVAFLLRYKQERPDLIDIVQHGWMHTNHAVQTGAKYEFGQARHSQYQEEDIHQGLQRMEEAFGKCWTSAFVPPYHGYNEQTLRILEGKGFQIFSANYGGLASHRMKNCPTHISFTDYVRGQKLIKQADLIKGQLLKSLVSCPIIGILTHHEDFNSESSREQLMQFFDFIKRGEQKMKWQITLLAGVVQ